MRSSFFHEKRNNRRSMSISCCSGSSPARTAGVMFRNLVHLACHKCRDISFLSHTVQGLVLDTVTCCHPMWHQECISNPCRKATAGRGPEFFCFTDHHYSAFGLWSQSYLGANKKRVSVAKACEQKLPSSRKPWTSREGPAVRHMLLLYTMLRVILVPSCHTPVHKPFGTCV